MCNTAVVAESVASPFEVEDFWLRGVLPPAMRGASITQEELQRLQQLKTLAREYEELRQQVREKYVTGAPIVAGELSLAASEIEQRSFSFDGLAAVIGAEKTRRLKDQLEPKRIVRLAVVESSSSAAEF